MNINLPLRLWSYLWRVLSVPIIAILVVGLISNLGQNTNEPSQVQQSQQMVSQITCSDNVTGSTEIAPPGTTEYLAGTKVNKNGIAVSVLNVSYISNVVMVHYEVTNKSKSIISSALYTNTGVIGSDGNYYYACLAGTVGCLYDTNSITVLSDETQTTCAAYLLPKNVFVTEIEYVPPPDSSNDYAANPILWSIIPNQNSKNVESF
jgi:hypothetical protein